jgi:hypothetical protein
MTEVGLEPTITLSERAKTVHVLDQSATVTGTPLTLPNRFRRFLCNRPHRRRNVHFFSYFGNIFGKSKLAEKKSKSQIINRVHW